MRFNTRVALAALFCTALTLGGCRIRLGGTPPSEPAMQMSASDSGCLSGSAQTLADYLGGKATAARVSGVWHCLSRSLTLFSERTRGSEPGVYSPDELKAFLEKYFLRDTVLSPALMREFMELKCTLLGGSPDAFTLAELEKTLELFRILDEQSRALLPYMPLTPDWARRQDLEVVDRAARALEGAAQALAQKLQKTGYDYPLARMEVLLRELGPFFKDASAGKLLERIHDSLPLLRAAKSILISPPGDRISGHEWVAFLTTAARWQGIFLRSAATAGRFPSITTGEGRVRFVALSLDALSLIDESILRHPGEFIRFGEFGALIDALPLADLPLPALAEADPAVAKPILKRFLRPLLRRVLGGSDMSEQGRAARGLTRHMIKRSQDFLDHWSEGQRYLEALFARAEAEGTLPDAAASELFPDEDLRAVTVDAAERLRSILKGTPVFFAGTDVEITLQAGRPLPQTLHNMTWLNGLRELARLLAQGYSKDQARALSEAGLLQGEFKRIMWDLRDFGILIKILDPARKNIEMIKTRFFEGRLFTFASDGDELLNMEEGTQLLTMMWSAYHLADRVHRDLLTGCAPGPKDAFGKHMLTTKCYRAAFVERFPVLFERLPLIAGYVGRLDEGGKQEFMNGLEQASRLPGSSPLWMNSNDSIGFAGVLQYIEALFARFDANADQVLDYEESKAAFPVFEASIGEIVRKKGLTEYVKPKDYEAVFTYLLAHSKAPRSSPDGIASWAWWLAKPELQKWFSRKKKNRWEFEADRMGLIQTFAELMRTDDKPPKPGAPGLPPVDEETDPEAGTETAVDPDEGA